MKEFSKIKDILEKLNYILTNEQKFYAILVFILSLIAAVFEMLGVSAIIPLMQAFLSPDTLSEQAYLQPFVRLFHLNTNMSVIIFTCVAVILVYLIKNVFSIFYVWISNKFSCKVMRELSVRILDAYMKQGYIFFVSNNSARLLRGVNTDVSSVYNIISQIFIIMSKGLTILCILVFIVIQTPSIAIFMAMLILFCFVIIQLVFRKAMRKYGKIARQYTYECNRAALEAIQGSKEVLVTNRQDYFVKQYRKCMEGSNKATVKMAVGSSAPANIIEAVCVTGLLIIVAFQMLQSNAPYALMSQLATIAVAAFRIMPALGGILSSINMLTYHAPGLSAAADTLSMVKQLEKEGNLGREDKQLKTKKFQKELYIDDVSFSYPESDMKVIDHLSMKIEKGTSVAFIGASGAGKTTLADLILNLLKPQSGKILVDGVDIEDMGRSWNKMIGYVPQSIYLTDSSIRKNIAFGLSENEIDDQKIWRALEAAHLKDFIEKQPQKLDSLVGERGVKFSGGQRQRVAIARALYNDPEILVLDEATAALDTETETAVMESIEELQGYKTLIIVAHRLTTIRNCDKIYEIKDGKAIKRQKKDIFASNAKEWKKE